MNVTKKTGFCITAKRLQYGQSGKEDTSVTNTQGRLRPANVEKRTHKSKHQHVDIDIDML